MISIYDRPVYEEIADRIHALTPASQRQWGKMNVAQMMAHCAAVLEIATGRIKRPRMLIGRILAPIAKPGFLSQKPFAKNSPSDPSFIVEDERDFNAEKTKLLQLLKEFSEGGEEKCTKHPHPFFGKVTPSEWSWVTYKHLDHHLRQFGV